MSQDEAQTTASDVTTSELLGAVKGFLMDSALPALSGRDQFNARVAANVLGIIEREQQLGCLLYTSPSPRDRTRSRMPSSA